MNKKKVKIEHNIYTLSEKEVKKALSDFIEEKDGFVGDIKDIFLKPEDSTAKVLILINETEVENKDV